MRNNEDIMVFYKKQCLYNPQGIIEGKFNNNRPAKTKESSQLYNKENFIPISTIGNYPLNTLYFNKSCINKLHSSQKPIDLLEYLIKTYTDEGEVILDNTIGSGSTAIACINTNRRYIGIEKNEQIYNIAIDRISGYKHIS
jgi:DNA modification methylase